MELSDLNQQQRKAVMHDTGPLLVVAGAGTGKTQVITRRIAYLIEQQKARPEEVLALTFTEKAAQEMEERVDLLVPYGVVDTQVMTFHAFGDSIIKEFGIDIGLAAGHELMSKSQQIVFLRDHFDEFAFDYYAPVGAPDKYLAALVVYFSRLKEELIKPDAYIAYAEDTKKAATEDAVRHEAAKHRELAGAYQKYIQLTREAGLLDFSDQITLAIEILERRPNVLKTLQQRFRYILVDEFQDTNLAQNHLLNLIAGSNGNIMVVGDDDQSIYKFRGAAVSNILHFTEQYPDAKQIVLTENYRSTQEVLDSAYKLIQNNNPDRLEVKNDINKRLTGQIHGPAPMLITESAYSLEADALANDIKKRIAAGEKPGEIAILVRKRNQASPVVQALESLNIPYRLGGRQSLYSQPEVQLLLDFLNVLTNPSDSLSLYHLLASDIYGADLRQLMTAASAARRRNQTLEEVLSQESTGDQRFDELISAYLRQIEDWRSRSRELSVGQIAFDFLQKTGYLDALTEDSKQNPLLELKIRNLSSFFGLLSDFERVAEDKSAMAFVLVTEALRAAGDDPEAGDADQSDQEVQIMTIHKAKGLEFNTVYIFDLSKGAFPSVRRRETLEIPLELLKQEIMPSGDWHLQEERRLMYVAMTRAKHNLLMTYSPDHGGILQKKPSPFIHEALGEGIQAPKNANSMSKLQQIQLFEIKNTTPSSLKPAFMQGEKLYLTPHQIDDYLSCPENFRYLYILQVPQAPNPALMYGSLVHAVINQYYLQRKHDKVDVAHLLSMVEASWSSDGFVSKGQELKRRKQIVQTIQAFIARDEGKQATPLYTEKEFQVEIPECDVVIRGRFDAVFEDKDGKTEIRDFKTSFVEDSGKADEKAKTSVQLALYALAWQRMTGKLPDTVTLDFVETGQVGTAVKTEADLAKTLADISKVANGIRHGDFGPGKSHFYCSHRKVDTDV